MRFILNLKGICSMTQARENLGLETLSGRRESARISLLMKIIADDTESSAVIRDSLSELLTNSHDHYTRMSQSSVPFTLQTNLQIFSLQLCSEDDSGPETWHCLTIFFSSKRSPLLPCSGRSRDSNQIQIQM